MLVMWLIQCVNYQVKNDKWNRSTVACPRDAQCTLPLPQKYIQQSLRIAQVGCEGGGKHRIQASWKSINKVLEVKPLIYLFIKSMPIVSSKRLSLGLFHLCFF